jgi:hypothetical protein
MVDWTIAAQGNRPNFGAAIDQGMQAYGYQQQQQQQNALQAYLQQNAQAIMAGDQNALAGLAQFDPQTAMSIAGDQQTMKLRSKADRRAGVESQASLADQAERLKLAQAQAKAEMDEHAVKMSAAQRAEAADKIEAIAADATQIDSAKEWDDHFKNLGPEFEELVGKFGDKKFYEAKALGTLESLKAQAPADPNDRYKVVGGTLVDLTAQGGPQPVLRGDDGPQSGIAKLNDDLKAGRIDQKMFDTAVAGMAPQGMEVVSDGQGGVTVRQGPEKVGRPLTEGQSKDNFYLTAVEHAKDVDDYEGALTGLGGAANDAAGMVPLVGKFMQSEAYQTGQVAAKEWGAAILRKESGAALTPADMEWLKARFIPVPGEKAGTIARKRSARRAAEAGLKSGMSKEQIEAVADAVGSVGDGAPAGGEAGPEQPAWMIETSPLTWTEDQKRAAEALWGIGQ